MIVIVSSNCKLKAKVRTRRIVSKYLEQIGPKVWMGYISNENLTAMHKELTAHRSINTSIICHKIVSRTRTEIIFRVGNMTHFNDVGNYAFSISKTKRPIEPNQSEMVSLMGIITGLSGLFHDLGKTTVGFQKKLSNAIENPNKIFADVIRHECVSYIMLTAIENDQHLLDILSSKESIQRFFNEDVALHLASIKRDIITEIKISIQSLTEEGSHKNNILSSKKLKQGLSAKKFKQEPILTALLWLVLNHHKTASMLDMKINLNTIQINLDDYLNLRYQEESSPEDFLTISEKKAPWNHDEWIEAVSSYGTQLKQCVQSLSFETQTLNQAFPLNTPWINLLTLCARPALVFADYYISMESTIDTERSDFTYANTRKDENGVIQWADDLPDHLLGVGIQSSKLFRELNAYYEHPTKSLPTMQQDDIPSGLLKTDHKSVPERFKWQNIALNHLKEYLSEHPSAPEQPAFMVLVSRTGSGKTRMAPAVMTTMCKTIRFTLGLGRRTLTLQSYKAYQAPEIGFSKGDIALLIGQTLPHDNPDEQRVVQGSEGAEFEDNHFIIRQSDPSLPEKVMDGKLKEMALLNAPISIMTIDHLVKTTYAGRSTDLKLLHHIQHSDLILDEIDDYSDKDITVLAKLIYIYGFFGRKVLLASATLPSAQIESLHHAFIEGLRMREGIYNTKHEITHIMINDAAPYVDVFNLKTEKQDAFIKRYTSFISEVCTSLQSTAKKHKVKIYDMPEDKGNLHSSLFEMCEDLHHQNYIKHNDIRISMGFVRFNNVEQAQEFAKYLNENNHEKYIIKTVCYHAKMLMIDRHFVEKNLDILLNRKSLVFGFSDPILAHPDIQAAIDQAISSGKKDVIIIISTTSIQETGRDHDYDWCLLEPLSSRSLVQAAGRVWRHRSKFIDEKGFNVGLMEYPIKAIQDGNHTPENTIVFGYPGIESIGVIGRGNAQNLNDLLTKAPNVIINNPTELTKKWINIAGINHTDAEDIRKRLFKSRDILDDYFFDQGIDASPCLKQPLTYLEHPVESIFIGLITKQFKNDHMLDFKKMSKSEIKNFFENLNSYTQRSDTKLINEHGKKNRFRQQEGKQFTLVAKESEAQIDYKSVWTYFQGRYNHGKVTIDAPNSEKIFNALFGYSNLSSEQRVQILKTEFNYTKEQMTALLSMSVNISGDVTEKSYKYSHFYGLIEK